MHTIARAATGLAIAAAACLNGPPATAQKTESSSSDERLVTIGLGPQLTPAYPGASGVKLGPRPSLGIRRPGDPIAFDAPDQGAGFGILGHSQGFDFGPAVRLRFKRDDKDVGAPVGNVGFTAEVGGFVQGWLTQNFRLRAEARKGIGGHKGWAGDLSADAVIRDGDRTIFSLGPRLRLADDRFHRAYFGVTPAVAARTGLAAFDPGGGIYAVGAVAGLRHQFSPVWGMNAYGGYDRLVRDAAASPIVRRFGSRDQFSVGLGLTYTFAVHLH
jgi:outer membrane protein